MKKALVLTVGLLFCAAMLFASGRQSSTTAPTITWMVSQDWTFPGDEEVIKKFKEATGITVDLQVIPSDQHHNLVRTRLSSGQGPDIFMVQTDEFSIKTQTIDPERYLMDMSNERWVSVMPKSRLPSVSYNGKVYGLMIWTNSVEWVYIYNKTMFNRLGLREPTNYAEMEALCQKLLDAGTTPIYEAVADGWHHQLPFFQIGPRYEERSPGLYKKLNENTIKFADVPDFVTALNQINSFAQRGFYGRNYMSNTYDGGPQAFASRNVAMITDSAGMISQIRSDYPEFTDEIGMFLLRFLDNNTFPTNPGAPAIFANKATRYPNEVRQFLEFYARPENIQIRLNGTPKYTNLDVTVPITQKWTKEEEAFMATITDYQKNIQGVLQTGTKYTNDQWMEFGSDLASMFMGRMTALEVLRATDERRANIARSQSNPDWR